MHDLILKIDGKEFKAKFNDGNPNIYINDNPYNVEMLKQEGRNIFSFSVNNKICHIEIDVKDYGNSRIILSGMLFDIAITDETKKLLNQYLKQNGSGPGNGAGKIKAPMPGLVVKILVDEGQMVEKGDKIVIIEAMKMENALQAVISGIVKSIKIREGQAVEKDAVLVEIEPLLVE